MNSTPLPIAIRRHAAARPRAAAIVDGQGAYTWADLDAAVDRVAARLQARGIEPGARVALRAGAGPAALAALVGILRAGLIAVPLGPRLTGREVAVAIGETGATLLVQDAAEAVHGLGGVETLALPELAGPGPAADRRGVELDPGATAVAVLTSGTSGRPKAACLSHAALAASAAAWTAALPRASGWLLCLGLAHVAGLGVAWRALLAGLPLHVVPFDPDAVAAALAAPAGPSHVSLVPVQLARLLDGVPGAARPAPAALRAVLLGGAPIPPGLVARAVGAGWPVVTTYGLTEAGSGVTALPAADAAAEPGSAGPPLPGVALRIARAGDDGVGEIEVLTPAAFSGYLGRPEADAAAFTEDGWLRTGDLGRLDRAGRLAVIDRRDDLVVSGGENVSPAEVEAVLEGLPAIAEAGVAGRPDAAWGAVPVAAVVLRPGAGDPGDAALRAECRSVLAPYKVPVAFARLAALPRTGSGKLRRSELREVLTPFVLLLHGTLSSARQLAPLCGALAGPGDLRVRAIDRLGSGGRRLDPPRPVAVAEHLADLEALLDEERVGRAILVGHSYGAVVALEAAARLPGRVLAVVAFEPPYAPLGGPAVRRALARTARATMRAAEAGGPAAAARAFMDGVAGPAAWEALSERSRSMLAAEGGGALADVGLEGLEPAGLRRIACPVTILAGGASEPWYGSIADALVARVPGAERIDLAGLRHSAPTSAPAAVAAAVRAVLARAGVTPASIVEEHP